MLPCVTQNAIIAKINLGKYIMTEEDRKYYDEIIMWARLSMSDEEYQEWYSIQCKPSSMVHPDGIFSSVKEYKEYFNLE